MWYLASKIGLNQMKPVENPSFVKIFNLASVVFKKIMNQMVSSTDISVHIVCQQVNSLVMLKKIALTRKMRQKTTQGLPVTTAGQQEKFVGIDCQKSKCKCISS